MALPGQLPYYMTGPASRPGAMKSKQTPKATRKGNKITLRSGAVVTVNPNKKKFGPIHVGGISNKKPRSPGKVINTGPRGTPPLAPTPTTSRSSANPGVTGRVVIKNPKNNTVPSSSSRPTPKTSQGGVQNLTDIKTGIDPKKMAQALTNQGYNASISAINQNIAQNQADMGSALADLSAWANQVSTEQARGAAESAAAWNSALSGAQASDANINQLFGGAAGGEAAAYSGVGEDLLGILGASDKSFNSRMAPILAAQAGQYQVGTRNRFMANEKDLRNQLLSAQQEKGAAYQKNLLDVMQMNWDRQSQIQQAAMAKAAFDQSTKMSELDVQGKQQDITAGQQQIEANKIANKTARLAYKRSVVELNKIKNQTAAGGFDWSDPHTGATIGQAALSGMLDQKSTFAISPKIAWKNAQLALQQAGLGNDPRAIRAAWLSFQAALNNSHGHKKWGQYYINKKGQLVYDPTRHFKKK